MHSFADQGEAIGVSSHGTRKTLEAFKQRSDGILVSYCYITNFPMSSHKDIFLAQRSVLWAGPDGVSPSPHHVVWLGQLQGWGQESSEGLLSHVWWARLDFPWNLRWTAPGPTLCLLGFFKLGWLDYRGNIQERAQ